jgi:DNA polymerase-3 subunit alpha
LEDFCRRLDSRVANRKMLESLVKCGAFDFLGHERAELFACIDEALAAASASHRDRASGQVSLFDDMPAPVAKTGARAVAAWTPHDTMSYEKELLGFYVTGHPLDAYASAIAAGNYQTIVSLGELADRASFRIGGAITQVDKKFTKKEGKPFAVIWLEDLTGSLEVVVWNEVYATVADALVPGKVIAIQGTLDKRDDTVRATAQKVKILTAMAQNGAGDNGVNSAVSSEDRTIILRFSAAATSAELLDVRQILASSPGAADVQLMFEGANGAVIRMNVGANLRVDPTAEVKQRLARWLAG